MVASPWGIGMLKLAGGSLTPLTMAPNGTRFGGWLLNTVDNRIWAAARSRRRRPGRAPGHQPVGHRGSAHVGRRNIGCLHAHTNGTRFGGWLLNTADNQFRSFQDMTGAGRAGIFVESPWGIGIMTLQGATFQVPVMAPNGTRLGNWLLNTHDNWF